MQINNLKRNIIKVDHIAKRISQYRKKKSTDAVHENKLCGVWFEE